VSVLDYGAQGSVKDSEKVLRPSVNLMSNF